MRHSLSPLICISLGWIALVSAQPQDNQSSSSELKALLQEVEKSEDELRVAIENYRSQILALLDVTLPPIEGLDLYRGKIVKTLTGKCFANPPLYLITKAVDQSLKQGDYMLRPLRRRGGIAVLGVLVPAEESSKQEDMFLVLDELTVTRGGIRSLTGETDKIFLISRTAHSTRLSARRLSFEVCKDDSSPVSIAALNVIASNSQQGSAWITTLEPTYETIGAANILSDVRATPRSRRMAFEQLEEAGAVRGSTFAVGNVDSGFGQTTPKQWGSVYNARAGSWDRCSPSPSQPEVLRCSGGVSVRLSDLVPQRGRFSLFGRETDRYLRIRLNSEPVAANIFFGAMKQSAVTNTTLDVRAEDVPKLRITKAGFQDCPYGSQWNAKIIDNPRQILEVTCRLRARIFRRK